MRPLSDQEENADPSESQALEFDSRRVLNPFLLMALVLFLSDHLF